MARTVTKALLACLLTGLSIAPAATAEELEPSVRIGEWFVAGCTSPLSLVDSQTNRIGVLVGQGHFGPDWEWGCLYRGVVGADSARVCIVNEILLWRFERVPGCLV